MRLPFNRFAFAVLVLLAAIAHGDPPPAAARPKLSLPELIKLSRDHSPIIAAARSQITVREMQKREAVNNWYPTGSLTFGVSPVPNIQCRDPNNSPNASDCLTTVAVDSGGHSLSSTYTGTAVLASLDALRNVAGGLSINLTQPIYTFGKIEHGSAAAGAGIEAERARTEGATFETELNVTRAYWGLKAARTSVITATDAREQLARWVDKMQADADAEKPKFNYSQTDLQRIKVALAQIDMVIADLERNVQIAETGLSVAVGLEVDIDEEELDAVEVIDHPLVYYQEEAVLHRPEVHALNAGSKAYRELQKLQLSTMLPDIALATSFSYRFAPGIQEPNNAYMNHYSGTGLGLSLGFSQPLDLFERHAHFTRARAEADAFDAGRRLAMAGISFEIAQAWSNLAEARRRMSLLDHSQHLAQGWLNAMEQKLDSGVSDPASGTRDLVDAARSYFEVRLRFYQSIFDVNVGIAVLRRATGVDVAH